MSTGTAIHFAGSDFFLAADDVCNDLRDALKDCGRGGQDATEAVAFVRSQFRVTGDEADCKSYLRGYGAWEDDELEDHDNNLERLVWLTGCALNKGEDAYFCAY